MLAADLSPWEGKNVRLRFSFDTLHNLDNQYEGVYIDDVQVVPRCVGGCCQTDDDCAQLAVPNGCSEARCIDLAGGAGPVCAVVPTMPGAACEPCDVDVQCADENPCTTDTCGASGVCEHAVFCCFEESTFTASFEDGIEPLTTGDSNPDDGVFWKVVGGDSVLGIKSVWIANEASGNYASDEPVDVSLTTPTFFLPELSPLDGGLGLSFWLRLSTEWDGQLYMNPAGIDRLTVHVVQGPISTMVWSSDEIGGSTDATWTPVELSLDPWSGAPIQVRFVFRTVDTASNDYEGPVLDAIKAGRVCPLE